MKYWTKLTPVEKESLLTVAKNYVQLKEDNLPLTAEHYSNEIEEAISRVQNGEFYTHEEVKKMVNEKNYLG